MTRLICSCWGYSHHHVCGVVPLHRSHVTTWDDATGQCASEPRGQRRRRSGTAVETAPRSRGAAGGVPQRDDDAWVSYCAFMLLFANRFNSLLHMDRCVCQA